VKSSRLVYATVLAAGVATLALTADTTARANAAVSNHAFAATAMAAPNDREARQPRALVTDQFNNRVVVIDTTHKILWHFGDGSSVAGPNSIVGPNDAERVGSFTLIAGTGAPAGTEPTCPQGCPDNRVIIVDHRGQIVWQYGVAGVAGSGFNQLNSPVFNVFLPNGHILIVDQGNERVIEVEVITHKIVWQYGQTRVIGSGFNQLSNPNSAELLANGHILIADENNNRVIEVNREHEIVWSYGNPLNTKILSGAAFASRLLNGNTLITDSNNNRIIEINASKQLVFLFSTVNRPGSIKMPLPKRAVRLRDGLTLISDQFNDQVIAVNRVGQIVFVQGRSASPEPASINSTPRTPPWSSATSPD